MKLTPELATNLAQLRARMKADKKEDKKTSDSVKKEMKRKGLEQYDPKESPYMLCRDESERSEVSWKDEWTHLAKDKYGKKWKQKMADLQEESKEPVVSLRVEPNPNYQGE